MVDYLANRERLPSREQMLHDVLSLMACHAAVRAGDSYLPGRSWNCWRSGSWLRIPTTVRREGPFLGASAGVAADRLTPPTVLPVFFSDYDAWGMPIRKTDGSKTEVGPQEAPGQRHLASGSKGWLLALFGLLPG